MRSFFAVLGILVLFFSLASASPHATYTVQQGDTLYDIAMAHGISWQELAQLNKLKNPALIQVGAVLRLPNKVQPHLVLWDGSVHEITEREIDVLVKLVDAEARGESLEGQIAVAAVVLNRVQSSKFPDTVWDVIHEPGQFTPVENGLLKSNVRDTAIEAVERALKGEDPTGGALFFYNPATSRALDYWQTKPVIKRIGNHNFTL